MDSDEGAGALVEDGPVCLLAVWRAMRGFLR
ncbi:hypothetical protein LILAB_17675 [Corallococcus macrosporus]|uniref:Uncharacterized protein n=1 Tax=Myxococcus fulvus (strain ATCC BAA-855 / HW-1) TaxID=483219 RepID=F8CQA8_MYXFH|nr:hypothetical protein LILAB_17675 [Corallococcus macrosporus]